MNNNLRESFSTVVTEVGLEDSNLVCIVSDISHFRMQGLASQRPNQYFNLGVCENSILNVAAGLSSLGKIPVVHTFASFLIDRSFEQIKVSFGYQSLGLNLVVIGSGIEYPYHGVTHHSYGDSVFIKTIENSQVFNPGSFNEFDTLFRQNYNNGKINLFRATTQPHHQIIDPTLVETGKVIKIVEGKDLTIIVTGGDLDLALDSVTALSEIGISAEVLYIHTLKPIDKENILDSIAKTGRFISIERQSQYGGLFSEISSLVTEAGLPKAKGKPLDLKDKYSRSYGSYQDQSSRLGFTPQKIVELAQTLI
jgi:transketolase